MTEQLPASVYPARLEIDYPDQHDRVTTLFRVFLVIPIAIVIGALTTGATETVYNQSGQVVRDSSGGISTGLFLATLLMILSRGATHAGGSTSPWNLPGSAPASAPTLRYSPTSTPRRSRSKASTFRSTTPTSNAT